MKRVVSVILLLVICALVFIAPIVFSKLPVSMDGPPSARGVGFRGILTVTVASTFASGKGGFSPYLLVCAREFEKKHPGVLVRVEEITVDQLQRRIETGNNLPHILLTGAGAISSPEGLLMPMPDDILTDKNEVLVARCSAGGVNYGVPVAMGAYGLIVNTSWLDKAQVSPSSPQDELFSKLSSASGKKAVYALQCPLPSYGLPQIALCQMLGALPDGLNGVPGDLGLANPVISWPEFALDQKFAMYVGTQRELERLRVLRSGGRAFETRAVALTGGAWTDQLLYAAMLTNEYENIQRDEAALAFIDMITSEPMQEKLKNIGVFSTYPGLNLYDENEISDMRVLEISLRDAIVPNVFGFETEYRNAAAAMRAEKIPNRVPLAAWQAVAGAEE